MLTPRSLAGVFILPTSCCWKFISCVCSHSRIPDTQWRQQGDVTGTCIGHQGQLLSLPRDRAQGECSGHPALPGRLAGQPVPPPELAPVTQAPGQETEEDVPEV